MRLLFDEHLSPRLVGLLSDIFPGSENVLSCGLGGAPDTNIIEHAASGFVLVSKDSDFVELVIASKGIRLVWLRLGNCTTDEAHEIIRANGPRIRALAESTDLVLELP